METPAAEAYEARERELRAENDELDRRAARISALRGITFLGAAGGGLVSVFEPMPAAVWVPIVALAVGFVALVVRHALLVSRAHVVGLRLRVIARAKQRMTPRFADIPETGARFATPDHPYALDLDVLGKSSLFQLVSSAETGFGEARLAAWLLEPASASVVRARQEAARELATLDRFREELAVEGIRSENRARDKEPLVAWAEDGSDRMTGGLSMIGRAIVPITIALLVFGETFGGSLGPLRHAWVAPFLVQVLILAALREASGSALVIAARDEPFGRYLGLFRVIEGQAFTAPRLVELRATLAGASGHDASLAIGKLQSILGYAELRNSGFVYVFANPLLLWDVFCAAALERWRKQYGKSIQRYLDAMGEIEAIASLASLSRAQPEYAFPTIEEGETVFSAEALGHPLIDARERVCNDVDIPGPGRGLLITGSNMSGKSTLLRAMGVNAVLALAGAPVCAKRLRIGEIAVRTSMRISDSLERKVSHFYAELAKLKSITTDAEGDRRVLFLLDEILHGTNSRERLIGAKAILLHLLERGAIGAASSHDLGLASLEAESDGRVVNVHFEENVEGDEMTFDYRLKTGVVRTANALRLMKRLGLPTPE